MGEQAADNLKERRSLWQRSYKTTITDSGLRRNELKTTLGGDKGTTRRGTRRVTDQVETGQGCTPAAKDEIPCVWFNRHFCRADGWFCRFFIHVGMPLWFVLFDDLHPFKKNLYIVWATIIISILSEVGTWGTYVEVHLIWVCQLICQTFFLSYNSWLWKDSSQHGITWNSPPVLHYRQPHALC